MSWPPPHDYHEAIQHPDVCLLDMDLRGASVEVDRLGLPRAVTGNFASVYRLHSPLGEWALRCFWRGTPDLQARYDAIGRHLARAQPRSFADFSYLADGILVHGRRYPVLKMQWVRGDTLLDFVSRHRRDSNELPRLATAWMRMAAELRRAGIAHGDLQHGNVLVRSGDVVLVDYDCLFVPELAGTASTELGHPNYQHPARTASHFGPALDNFSLWLVYLSLQALSVDPSLWEYCKAGDERLLLGREDLNCPGISRSMERLVHHVDPRISALARRVRAYLDLDPLDVPALEEADSSAQSRWRRPGLRTNEPARAAASSVLPDWVYESLQLDAPHKMCVSGGRWPRVAPELVGLLGMVGAAAAIGLPVHLLASIASACLVAGSIGARALAYRGLPDVREHRRSRTLVRRAERTASRFAVELERKEQCLNALRTGFERRFAEVALQAQEVERWHAEWIDRLEREKEDAQQPIDREVHRLRQGERDLLVRVLRRHHQYELERRLRAYRVLKRNGPPVSLPVRLALWACGAHSAARIRPRPPLPLRPVPPGVWQSVNDWRERCEVDVRPHLPSVLPAEVLHDLQSPFSRRISSLMVQISALQSQVEGIEGAVAAISSERKDRLEAGEEEIRRRYEQTCASLQAELGLLVDGHRAAIRRIQGLEEDRAELRIESFPRYLVRCWTRASI